MSARRGPEREEQLRALLRALLAAVRGRGFYPLRHPTVARAVRDLAAAYAAALAPGAESVVGVVGRRVIVDGSPLAVETPVFERLRELLAAHGVEKLELRGGAGPGELENAVETLAATPESLRAAGGLAPALAARGVRAVGAGRFSLAEQEEQEGDGGAWGRARRVWEQGAEGVRDLHERIAAGRPVGGGEAREVAATLLQGLRGQRGPMLAALALRQKSAYTFSHSLNVSLLMLAQVDMLGLPERRLEEIAAAGLLHDIGKLLVPVEILEKPGPLDERERVVMNRHPTLGVEVLRRMRDAGDLSVIVAFEHHLRHDGTGYPRRRAPWPANRATALAAIADCYDALRSRRPYDDEWPCERVHARMTELAGTAFDPPLLERFFRIVGLWSPGTLVRLSSGAVGKVVRNHPSWIDRPTVQLLRDATGRVPADPTLLDLALEREQRAAQAVSVVASLSEKDYNEGPP